ncbi:hypothetical protein C8F01DRAFT_1369227 [Mycena amicta]|nr:hypothetical protein C8F01DRAFT_1369227 [Mycena amicta]
MRFTRRFLPTSHTLAPPMSDDSKFLHIVNATQIYIACSTSIVIWDWLSCLPLERKYFWKSKSWSPVKVLYCMVRYYTLMVLIAPLTVTDVWYFSSWSESSCSRYVRILPGVAVLIFLSVEAILAIRIYALYGCDKRIAVFLIAMLAAFLGVMIAVPIVAFDYTQLPSWPGPCMITGKPSMAGPKFIIAFYASPMTCDMITTGLALYRLIDQNKRGRSSSLMNRMVRDGLLYFCAITSLNLLNVIFFIQSDKSIQPINTSMSIQISSVLCCRLILSLRSKSSESVKRYSRTRGRWVADILYDDSVIDDPLPFFANPPIPPRAYAEGQGLSGLPSPFHVQPNGHGSATMKRMEDAGIVIDFEQAVEIQSDASSTRSDELPTTCQ